MYKGVSNNSLIDFYFSNLRNIERAESTDHNSNSCVKVSGAGTMSEPSTMSEPTDTTSAASCKAAAGAGAAAALAVAAVNFARIT